MINQEELLLKKAQLAEAQLVLLKAMKGEIVTMLSFSLNGNNQRQLSPPNIPELKLWIAATENEISAAEGGLVRRGFRVA